MIKKQKICTLITTETGEQLIRIDFPYNTDTLEQIRTIPGRRYLRDATCWHAPLQVDIIEMLRRWGFIVDSTLENFIKQKEVQKGVVVSRRIRGLRGTLFPFQKEGVAFIEQHDGRALIADEMGLGKTVQALAWLQMNPEKRPAIIVVPASLKLNWKKEAEKWMLEPAVEVLSGTKPWRVTGEILIINYDVMPYWVEELRKQQPQVLVLDEIHYIKSNSAQRTKATKKLAKGIPYIIGLGGTFIVNRPIEGYNALKLIAPTLFPDYWTYAREYCAATYNGFGWNFNGASNVEELHRILTSTVMIRRLKKDVLQDLPDKIYSFVPMELDNEKEYEMAERDFIAFVRAEKGKAAAERASNAIAFAKTEGLRQLAVKGKLKHAIEWIKDFLEEDNKLVVFATHRFVIDTLMEEFGRIAVKIDGTTTMAGRQMAVEDFQHKKHVRLFIGNIKAAGVGITLTAASNVAFLELPWTPGDLVQAQDRCHRIGQKECVNIHYLLARDTIEEKIARVIDRKQVVLDAILDGKETSVDSLLQELMNQYDEE